MRITPQISGATVVLIGHFNPLIFRPSWFEKHDIIIGSDLEGLEIKVVHAELVAFQLKWGQFNVERERLSLSSSEEPLIRTHDFIVNSLQKLPETPIRSLGINREIHFDAGSTEAWDHVGDTLAPKDFWQDLLFHEGKKAGGLKTLVMEQSIMVEGEPHRLDGSKGHIQFKIEPSVQVPNGIFLQVNDHFGLTNNNEPSDGGHAAKLISGRWSDSLKEAETFFDRVMEIAQNVRR